MILEVFPGIQKMNIKSGSRPSSVKAPVFLNVDRFPVSTPKPLPGHSSPKGKRWTQSKGQAGVQSPLEMGVEAEKGWNLRFAAFIETF